MSEGTVAPTKLDEDIVTRVTTGCYDCGFTVPVVQIMDAVRQNAANGAYAGHFNPDESSEVVIGAIGGALAGHAAYNPGHKVWIKIRKGKA